MSGAEGLGLQLLLRAIQTLFGEAIKDSLKQIGSTEKAKERAFYLYELLEEVSLLTEAFIISLRSYVHTRSVLVDSLHKSSGQVTEEDLEAEDMLPDPRGAQTSIWSTWRALIRRVGSTERRENKVFRTAMALRDATTNLTEALAEITSST